MGCQLRTHSVAWACDRRANPMRVGVKVTGHLIDLCSATHVDLDEGACVDTALGALGIPPAQVGLVSVNGEAVPKAKRSEMVLRESDEMVVMAPLTGG